MHDHIWLDDFAAAFVSTLVVFGLGALADWLFALPMEEDDAA